MAAGPALIARSSEVRRIDGWRLRERQVGIAGYYNFDPLRDLNFSFAAGVFNGNGDVNHYAGWDSDEARDVATRGRPSIKMLYLAVLIFFAPYTRNIAANVNNTRMSRH